MNRPFNILFLCTGNSARSILGEALMNQMAEGRVRAYSAGSQPKGDVHPMALDVLSSFRFSTHGLFSKNWSEFAKPGAPEIDFIFTVCDNAAGESCPVWLGHPMTGHWGIEDPAAVEGDGQREAFIQALRYMQNRISLFLALPHASLDELAMRRKIKEIGQSEGTTIRDETPA